MKIGIDARFIGPQGTGLGKYTEKLLINLEKIDKNNSYYVFLNKKNYDFLNFKSKNFTKTLTDIPWYSAKEQLQMPSVYNKQNLDLLHVPHFNVPILYNKKFIVTIHDLIHHHFSQESTTTRNKLIFKLKRYGYKKTIKHAIYKSQKIIVPSKYVKADVIHNYPGTEDKIRVIAESFEEEYKSPTPTSNKFSLQKPYILYVGNAYPHKNLSVLLRAIKSINDHLQLNLVIVSARSIFTKRLLKEINDLEIEKFTKVLDFVETDDLVPIYKNASIYVFPSLSEGFGIPALNAMASGIPVIASNIDTFKEVYADAVIYFDKTSPKDLVEKIELILTNDKIRKSQIEKGEEKIKSYSWEKMAKETLELYSTLI